MQVNFPKIMNDTIAKAIEETGIIAVIVIDDLDHAKPLAEALLKGGVDTIELTLRTPVAIEAGHIIKKNFPDITLGFGTVLTSDQVKAVVDAGADFAVAPGCNPSILQEAKKQGLSFAPGIMTPSDIEMAIQEGCRILKFFPAESSGGMPHLKSMAAPYQYLGLKFIPLGGVNMKNAANYLQEPLVAAIGGSWLAKRNLIQDQNWVQITQNAKEIKALIHQLNKEKIS